MNTRLICIHPMFQRSTIAISSPQSMESGKRPVSTPNQLTPKRRVVDDIISSVEKLKLSGKIVQLHIFNGIYH